MGHRRSLSGLGAEASPGAGCMGGSPFDDGPGDNSAATVLSSPPVLHPSMFSNHHGHRHSLIDRNIVELAESDSSCSPEVGGDPEAFTEDVASPSEPSADSNDNNNNNQDMITRRPSPERPVVPSSTADWEAKKDIIHDLYMNQNLILNEVIDIMLATHNFKAT